MKKKKILYRTKKTAGVYLLATDGTIKAHSTGKSSSL